MIDIKKTARIYHLPPRCAITTDDLVQEAHLAILEREAALSRPLADNEVYATARWAMQQAIDRYASPVSHTPIGSPPVTRSLDEDFSQKRPEACLSPMCENEPSADTPDGEELVPDVSPQQLHTALAQLSPRQQFVLRRIYDDGVTHAELAQEMGVAPTAIRKTKQRALSHLRHILAPKKK